MTITSEWASPGGEWSILVHGGAGHVPDDRVQAHAAGCVPAVEAAAVVLRTGGSALDAVQAAVTVLEDDPKYNAGTGGSLSADGALEHDASIMAGATLAVGAVCSLRGFKNPIAVARAVLDDGAHALYAGAGAAAFARSAGFEAVDEATLITEAARRSLERALARGQAESWAGGTVGAVARDAAGHVAAATSTGGTVAKRPGRVGDTPLAGAGTYADDLGGAASATGLGEGILRVNLTGGIVAALRDGALPEHAARSAIAMMEERVGATGGVIVVDRQGRLGFARSTRTMSWAAARAGSDAIERGA